MTITSVPSTSESDAELASRFARDGGAACSTSCRGGRAG